MFTAQQTIYPEREQYHEANDCTVRALCGVTGMSYTAAHAMASSYGRKYRHGFNPREMVKSLESRGFVVREVPVSAPTMRLHQSFFYGTSRLTRRGGESVETFLRRMPKRGRFYVCSTRHAFAYVDGKVLDIGTRVQNRAKMAFAFEIAPIAPKPPEQPTQAQINELWARLDKLEGRERRDN